MMIFCFIHLLRIIHESPATLDGLFRTITDSHPNFNPRESCDSRHVTVLTTLRLSNISIHESPATLDYKDTRCYRGGENFNPRESCDSRRYFWFIFGCYKISIHESPATLDALLLLKKVGLGHFNPRESCDSRQQNITKLVIILLKKKLFL